MVVVEDIDNIDDMCAQLSVNAAFIGVKCPRSYARGH